MSQIKFFETAKVNNNSGLMNILRLDQFSPADFSNMDAPEWFPSGAMESWTSVVYPVVQGVCSREDENDEMPGEVEEDTYVYNDDPEYIHPEDDVEWDDETMCQGRRQYIQKMQSK